MKLGVFSYVFIIFPHIKLNEILITSTFCWNSSSVCIHLHQLLWMKMHIPPKGWKVKWVSYNIIYQDFSFAMCGGWISCDGMMEMIPFLPICQVHWTYIYYLYRVQWSLEKISIISYYQYNMFCSYSSSSAKNILGDFESQISVLKTIISPG